MGMLNGRGVVAPSTGLPTMTASESNDSGSKERIDSIANEILTLFRVRDEPVIWPGEDVDEIAATEQEVRAALEQLEREGVAQSKSVGDGRIWWLEVHTGGEDLNEIRSLYPGNISKAGGRA